MQAIHVMSASGDHGRARMLKLTAVVNVISWAGFWAFGFLALSAPDPDERRVLVAALLAGLGFLTGTFTYLRLSRGIAG